MPPRLVPVAPDGRPLADFGDRLLACLIDSALFAVLGFLLAIPAFFVVFASITNAINQTKTDPATGQIISQPSPAAIFLPILGIYAGILLVTFLASYVYQVEMMYRTGTTWGKRVMKLRVVSLENLGAPLTRGIAAKRWAVQVLGGFVPLLSWLDGLWQLWDQPYRQCLHDKVAKTVVVKVSGLAKTGAAA
jgi:uncharacterized RDD family membrane protein YckC